VRGFITLATGDDHYYYLANNLLKSYRFRGGKYPFAILCDRENKYTSDFDKVVILDGVSKTYLDKFRILIDAPYDENFFIEPDCLVYQNIDYFFELFKDASDISSFGWNDASFAHYLNEQLIKKRYGFDKAPMFCPGYMYIRNRKMGEGLTDVYKDAMEMCGYVNDHKEEHPNAFVGLTLRDDPIFSLIMKKHGFTCVAKPSDGKCIHYPSFKVRNEHFPKMNFKYGYLEDDKKDEKANICHFSTKHTKLGKYNQQVYAMDCYLNNKVFMGTVIETNIVGWCLYIWFRIKNKFVKA